MNSFSYTRTVMAKTKNGRVRHGNIEGNMFVRFVSHKDINWSEKAFSLNTSVMPTLKKEGVGTLKFYYRGKQFDRVYLYPLEEAFKIGNLVQLDGEENLRMPIDDKYVSEIIKNPNYVEPEPPAEDPQAKLF